MRIEVFRWKTEPPTFGWRLVAGNNQVLVNAEAYSKLSNALRAASKTVKSVVNASIPKNGRSVRRSHKVTFTELVPAVSKRGGGVYRLSWEVEVA